MESLSLLPIAGPLKVTDGVGGSYYAWNNTNFPFLGFAEVGSAILTLRPNGFAMPHYADCNKIGYVAQGTEGIAGIIDPITSKEKVVKLKKGDAIVVPGGVVSWWYNAGHDDLKYIFLGQSSKNLGQLIYCKLTGTLGILKGFSTKTLAKSFDLDEQEANKLTNSQNNAFLFKIDDEKPMPKSNNEDTMALCFDFTKVSPDFDIENGGSFTSMTCKKHPPLEGVTFSGNFMRLEPNAMFGPIYYAKSSGVQLSYVVEGSGYVQVVGMDGKIAMETPLKAGELFAVPKFYSVAIGAGDEGIECFSIVTNSEPIVSQLTGKTSVWNAMSPEALQASLSISPEFSNLFVKKLNATTIIRPSR